jgi:predicted homoserine dehydrogenase-like protein
MAERFYSCEFGTTMKSGVTETATTTAAADVEVRIITDATGTSKMAALNAIDAIKQKILEDTWAPA